MSRYGLLGKKLSHSFSKVVHEEIMDYQYELIEIEETELDYFFAKKEFSAINVTVPYKERVIEYLDEIDESVKKINACNCIVNTNGYLKGYNTDYAGFKYLLDHNNIKLTGYKVCLLGNGGAAKAIKAVLINYNLKELIVVKKNISNDTITYDELYKKHQDIDLIINSSYIGMYPNNYDDLIDLSKFNSLKIIIDVIYNPLKTNLIVQGEKRGIKCIGGLEMLVAQAVIAIEYFKNLKLDLNLIDDIYQRLMQNKLNIVLIGMPSSGKTTIGKELSEVLEKQYLDLDDVFQNEYGNIKTFFLNHSEAEFRELESEITLEISKKNSLVISTGGGVILNEENIDALRQNSIIFYLKRDLDKLEIGGNRPLSVNTNSLKELYSKRKNKYEKYSDYIIENNRTIKETIDEIMTIIREKK